MFYLIITDSNKDGFYTFDTRALAFSPLVSLSSCIEVYSDATGSMFATAMSGQEVGETDLGSYSFIDLNKAPSPVDRSTFEEEKLELDRLRAEL